MKNLFLLFFTLLFSSQLFADAKSFYFKRAQLIGNQNNKILSSLATFSESVAREKRYAQYIDHENSSDDRTFSQRYYLDTRYAKSSDAPVILYICGESTCRASSLDGAVKERAREWGAVMVALEHRYYGKSQPFTDLSTENLKYLSVKQALADLDRFQKSLTREQGFNGKWVAVGGSYPGNLAALYRLKYPTNVVGALASSAPVLAKENFEEYDAHVTKVAGPICVANMRKAVEMVEAILDSPAELANVKEMFQASDVIDKIDFIYLIADIAAAAVQYGYKDYFCNMINVSNPLDGYAQFAKKLFRAWGMTALSMTFQSAEDTNPDSYLSGFGMRQWLYQSCTEYGYWQNAHHNPAQSSRSSLISLEYHHNACKRLFGMDIPADTDGYNDEYYWPLFDDSTTNILFTNGSTDPWSMLSVVNNENNPLLTTYVIEGAAHCNDLHGSDSGDSIYLKKSRSLFKELAESWLNI